MLRATHANPGRIDVAQGTIVEHCVQFYSDKDLRGRKIAVDLGLFVSSVNELGKLSPAWQLIYPLTGSGSTFMTLVGTTQQWQNYEVILTALDSQNFVVQLKFVQLADLTTYLGTTPFDSYQYFTGAATQGGPNIYDSLKFLSIKATVQHPNGLESATNDVEWSALRWCENPDYLLYTDYFTTDIKNVNGWVTGKDLTVRFQTSSQDPINAKWYGGIIRASSGNMGAWWDDIRLQYGTFAQFVSQVNTTFDFSYLTDSRVLKGDTYGNYEGLFVVDSSYFISGESYQAFFIWEENGTLKSCISNVFGEEVDPDSPVLVFDSDNTITLNDNADIGTLNETCLHNLSPCQDVTVCTTIDAVSFDAALTAAGLPYTLDQLISGTLTGIQAEFFAYGAEFLQVNSPPIFTNFTYPLESYVPNVSWQLCAQFNVPTEWQGETRYVFLFVKLALPGGGFYEILFPFTFSVVEYGTILEPTVTPKQFYCEDTGEIEFCFDSFDDTFNFIAKVNGVEASDLEYVSSIDPDFTGGDACLTIDYTKIAFNQDICFCLVAQKNIETSISPGDCPCGNIEFAFTSTYNNTRTIYRVVIDLTDLIPIATGSSVTVSSSLFNGQQGFNDENIVEVIFVGPNSPNETLEVALVTADGCVYIIGVGVPLDPTTFSVEVCPSNTKIISIPCQKDPALDVFCTGGLFYEANLTTDGGTIDYFEYTFDFNTWTPYTVPVALTDGAEIFIKALITYTEVQCGTFELWGSLKATECDNCYEGIPPINSCPDYLNVSVNWNEQGELLTLDGELLLNIFGESASTCDASSDSNSGLEYSFDGITYFDYTVPIDTTGYNVVYYQWFTSCGGCADTVAGMWERDKCCGSGTAVVVGLCEAMSLLPYVGPMTPNDYILTQDPVTEDCQLVSFEICPFLVALLSGEPALDETSDFIYIDGDGLCKKGSINICNWVTNLTEPSPYPGDLIGLLFVYQDALGACYKIDISGYLGGSDQAGIQFKDETLNLGTSGTVTSVDFIGAGVVATRLLNEITVTITDWQDKVQYKDEGANLGALGTVDTVDFVGAGVTATRVGDVVTVTIPGTTSDEQDKIQFQDEGSNLGTTGTVDTLDFVGTGITASRVGNVVTVTVPGNVNEQDQIQFEDEGVNLGTAGTVTELDFVGSGVTASRALDKVTVTIPDWQSKVQYKDEGSNLGTAGTVDTVDFVGNIITGSRVGNTVTVTVNETADNEPIQFQDEGSNLGTTGTVDTLDFVGSGVVASRVGNIVTVTIPGNVDEQDQIQFQNEGVNLGTAGTVTEYDHVGPNVTATRALNKVTVTYSAWQALMQYYENGVALGTTGTVTDFNRIGTFGELSRISNTITLDFGPYEYYEVGNASHVATKLIWFYYFDCTAGNLVFDLPAAAGNGSLIYVKKIDSTANTLQIRPDGTDLINGVNTSYYLTGYNEGVVIKSDLDGLTKWQFVATNLTNHTGEIIGQRNLTAHKTLITNRTAVTAVGTDYVLIGDTSDSDNLKKALISDFANVTHTGEVTGATVLTVDKTAISNKTQVVAAETDMVLIGDASDSNNLKKVPVGELRTYERVGFTIDGGGSVVTAKTGFTQLKFPVANATLVGVTIISNIAGNIVFTIKKSTFAGFPTTASIVGANLPELVAAQKAEITLDNGWTTSFASGDILEFGVSGTPTLMTWVTLIMYYKMN